MGKDDETKYLIPLPSCPRCLFGSRGNYEGVQTWLYLGCTECEGGISYMNPFNAKARNKEDEEEHVGEE